MHAIDHSTNKKRIKLFQRLHFYWCVRRWWQCTYFPLFVLSLFTYALTQQTPNQIDFSSIYTFSRMLFQTCESCATMVFNMMLLPQQPGSKLSSYFQIYSMELPVFGVALAFQLLAAQINRLWLQLSDVLALIYIIISRASNITTSGQHSILNGFLQRPSELFRNFKYIIYANRRKQTIKQYLYVNLLITVLRQTGQQL
ncbi:Hypothetical_protein [Hexamita inflata]|uniref:Hypothetical_protein n=1 Tax=Hexamita inflata TaxID=28002 RepID=A0AA86PG16_9EUKA|nr:Hypothetical protein HINF_LOCUS25136 [Hexamita inflata]